MRRKTTFRTNNVQHHLHVQTVKFSECRAGRLSQVSPEKRDCYSLWVQEQFLDYRFNPVSLANGDSD